jgi:uncharacterized membrane protein YfcA
MMELFGVEPWFFAALMIVAFIGFVLSATFGVGGAMLLIPMLAQRMPAAHAVALAAPVMLFNNVLKAWVFRKYVSKRGTFLVSALALPFAFAGAYVAGDFDDRAILIGIAILIVLSIVVERFSDRVVKLGDRALLFWGGVTGAISGLCGAAGPPTAIGLRAWGLDKEAFVGTVAVFAILLQIVKMPAYVMTDVLPAERWPLALALSVTALLGVVVAPSAVKAMPKRAFGWGLDVLLLVTAAWLLIDVFLRTT